MLNSLPISVETTYRQLTPSVVLARKELLPILPALTLRFKRRSRSQKSALPCEMHCISPRTGEPIFYS